jgi:hypothetical protein
MMYDDETATPNDRSDDAALDPRQLLRDIDALVAAGLVVPVRDPAGVVRMTPTEPLTLLDDEVA